MGQTCGAGKQPSYDYFSKATSLEVNVESKGLPDKDIYQFSQDYTMLKVVKPEVSYQQALEQAHREARPFTDELFPPGDKALGLHDLNYLPVWKRIGEMYPDHEFLAGGIRANSLVPGEQDDSYFIAALSAFARYPNRIEKMFIDTKPHHREGCYMVRLRQGGVRKEVLVDDHIPVNPLTGRPAFMEPVNRQIWPMVVEKAWAKLNGSYGAIRKGKAH
jgi:calpain-15